MLDMQIKFFEGELTNIEKEFNKWSGGKYISETSLHFKGLNHNTAVMKVVFGLQPKKQKLGSLGTTSRPKGDFW